MSLSGLKPVVANKISLINENDVEDIKHIFIHSSTLTDYYTREHSNTVYCHKANEQGELNAFNLKADKANPIFAGNVLGIH